MTIDRANLTEHRPQRGDVVLNRRGEETGTVLRVRRDGRLVWSGSHGVRITTRGTWDEEILQRGLRLFRPEVVREEAA